MPSEKLVYSTDSIAAAINNLKLPGTTATSADGGTIIICCPSRVTFEAVYDCSTGTVIKWVGDDGSEYTPDNPPPAAGKWVSPPMKIVVRGSNGVRRKGIVTKVPPPGGWTPENYTGTDGAGHNLGEVIDWSEWESTAVPHPSCDVANAAVFAVEAALEEMGDTWSYIQDGVGAVSSIAHQAGLLGGIFYLPGALAVYEIGIPTAIIIAILESAVLIIDKLGGGLTNGFAAARQDLICAIYGASSAKDLKIRWDAAVNVHWYVIQPQNALVKYLMTAELAEVLTTENVAVIEGKPKYGFNCDVCPGNSFRLVHWYDSDHTSGTYWYMYVWDVGGYNSVCSGVDHSDYTVYIDTVAPLRLTWISGATVLVRGNPNCAGGYGYVGSVSSSTILLDIPASITALNIGTRSTDPAEITLETI